MSEKSNLYEIKMSLFDNGNPEGFFLFIHNFNMTIKATGTLKYDANIQKLGTLVRGEALRKFDVFFAEVESASPEALKYIILGLDT